MTRTITARHVNRNFPQWLWRELFIATREASDRIPVLVAHEAGRSLIVLDLDDYNELMAAPPRRNHRERLPTRRPAAPGPRSR